MPTYVREIDHVNLATSQWGCIPNLKGVRVPFGYVVDPNDETNLIPVLFELEALKKAKEHLAEGHSLRKVAEWLSDKTGRSITHEGLRQRVLNDRAERKRADVFRRWAESIAKAVVETKKYDKKFKNDDSWSRDFLERLREEIEGET